MGLISWTRTLMPIMYCTYFVGLIFAVRLLSAKTVKIGPPPPPNFPLYGTAANSTMWRDFEGGGISTNTFFHHPATVEMNSEPLPFLVCGG